MSDLIENIKKKEMLFSQEIGALLHDIGKCHPILLNEFTENIPNRFKHADINEFLDEN